MSEISAIVTILDTFEDFGGRVHDNGLAVPKQTPAALVDLATVEDAEPEELGTDTTETTKNYIISLVVKVDPSQVGAARDSVADIARRVRRALRADPMLSGSCMTSRLEPTEHAYVKAGGQDYARALIGLTVLVEE